MTNEPGNGETSSRWEGIVNQRRSIELRFSSTMPAGVESAESNQTLGHRVQVSEEGDAVFVSLGTEPIRLVITERIFPGTADGSAACRHEIDWSTVGMAGRSESSYELGARCRHCGESAFATVRSEQFAWNLEDDEPLDDEQANWRRAATNAVGYLRQG